MYTFYLWLLLLNKKKTFYKTISQKALFVSKRVNQRHFLLIQGPPGFIGPVGEPGIPGEKVRQCN